MNESGTKTEEGAVGETLMRLGKGFATCDAAGFADIYAEDADWTNAFGTRCHGRQEIIAYLEKLFADSRFGAGRLVGKPEASIRFAGDGKVAIAHTYAEREGQQTVEGGELPVRRNHSLKVLEKRGGHWLIVSEIYMDARDEETLVDR
jgi:uncharacterized protein (TIGR02246 family)